MFKQVKETEEFKRVFSLPRRPQHRPPAEGTLDNLHLTGKMELKPIQAQAIYEAKQIGGLFAPIGVGHGKTLISLLCPTAMNSKKSLILCPHSLKDQMRREMLKFSKHFAIKPEIISIHSYNDLSRNTDLIEKLNPDLVIADEAHKLKNLNSARTTRFMRYMLRRRKEAEPVRFCALSGTMTVKSIHEYAHLIILALGENSPIPNNKREIYEWSCVLDYKPPEFFLPGALSKFCKEGEEERKGFSRRLVETLGVVATSDTELPFSLNIKRIDIEADYITKEAYKDLHATWSIGGEEFSEALDLDRYSRQLAHGFYYQLDWPGGIIDVEYVTAQRKWAKLVRDFLSRPSNTRPDSEGNIKKAIDRGEYPELKSTLETWREQSKKPKPPRKTVWMSYYLLPYVKDWISKNKQGIIWSEHKAMEKILHEQLGLPVYGEGTDASVALPENEPVIVCSVQAQGTGKNMQKYSRNLLLSVPSNGGTIEQLLGRTHRQGQQADEVQVDWFNKLNVDLKNFREAKKQAKYMQQKTTQKQKILQATHTKEKETRK